MNKSNKIYRIIIVLIILIIIIFLFFNNTKSSNDKNTFAYKYFENRVEIAEILLSKGEYDFSDGWRGCIFGIVRISDKSSTILRNKGISVLSGASRKPDRIREIPPWPETEKWHSTPIGPISPHGEDAFLDCEKQLPTDVANEIHLIFSESGSFAYRSWNRVALVSPARKMIAVFRYDD